MNAGDLLAGIRVLDLTTIVVGPVSTLRLADYGAEVIKLEPPGGDLLRSLGGASPTGGHSGTFLHLNRGKKGLCLDVKQRGASRVLAKLLDDCDAVVTNMRPEALVRLGLDAATVRAERPALVHCTITGFGPGGPYRGRAAYDIVIQGASGVAGAFERRHGVPSYVPFVLCDHVVGEVAAGAVLAALVRRFRSGEGCALEVPMFETMASFVLHEHLGPHTFEPPLGPVGDRRILDAANLPIRTADGWLSITTNSDVQTRSLLRAIGREALADDPRFSTVAARLRHIGEWYALRNAGFAGRTTAAWLDILMAADVPAMQCHSLDTLLADPHLEAVGLVGEAEHPAEGRIRTIRPTVIANGEVTLVGQAAPLLGADAFALLDRLGFSAAEMEELRAEGVLAG